MTARRAPLFLARRSYRRRRVADAARLLPFLGLFLILLPILWQPRQSPAPDTAAGGVYLFAVWAVLVLGAFLLSRVLGAPGDTEAGGGAAEAGSPAETAAGANDGEAGAGAGGDPGPADAVGAQTREGPR